MVITHERTLDIPAPVAQVFAVVRDPATYPAFLRGVTDVRRRDDDTLEFTAGSRTWEGVVTEMVADVSVGWTSRGEPVHTGLLALERIGADRTRVTLRIDQDDSVGRGDDPTADLAGLAELVRARPAVAGERRILPLAALFDHPVTDGIGEPLGVVRDLHLDLDDRRITSLAVGREGDDVAYLVPVPALPVEEAIHGISVPHPAGMIWGAPEVEPGVAPEPEVLAAAERHFADRARWEEAQAAARGRQAVPAPIPGLQGLSDDAASSPGVPAPTPEIADAEAVERAEHEAGPPGR